VSHFLDRLQFLNVKRKESFSDGHGVTTKKIEMEDGYRRRLGSMTKLYVSTQMVLICTGSLCLEDF